MKWKRRKAGSGLSEPDASGNEENSNPKHLEHGRKSKGMEEEAEADPKEEEGEEEAEHEDDDGEEEMQQVTKEGRSMEQEY